MKENSKRKTNRLINETSPYLLQHAHNPVEWYPWGEEAFTRAKSENKLVVVSIGYASCHWCHVMERETFEDEEAAEMMNRHFVSIKIDREERPDIDHIFMNAVQLINGSGGWPLNCIALPDGRPVYGGSYFSTAQWLMVLSTLSEAYTKDPQSFITTAGEIEDGIISSSLLTRKSGIKEFDFSDLVMSVERLKPYIDDVRGGTLNAPKFPMPSHLAFLIDYSFYKKDSLLSRYIEATLGRMASGGIFDQIGGGFARYSTDELWLVPHFEKMLYDNAQMISLYSRAYCREPDPLYKKTVYDTFSFLERDMSSPEKGYYSAIDADSEGEEGRFYVWSKHEIDSILGEDSAIMCFYYGVTESGNWEYGKNILHVGRSAAETAGYFGIDENTLSEIISRSTAKLLAARNSRTHPALDDKILASWNALTAGALCEAFITFNDRIFLQRAIETADFILQALSAADFRLNRSFRNGRRSVNGYLDDYAFTIDSMLRLYAATGDIKYFNASQGFMKYALEHFFDDKSGMFFYTSDLDHVIVTKRHEIDDSVIPSSNSVMAKNLYMLGFYLNNEQYRDTALQMLSNIKNGLLKNPLYFSGWGSLALLFARPVHEIAVVGAEAMDFTTRLQKKFRPDIIVAASAEESGIPVFRYRYLPGKTGIHICINKTCMAPVFSVEEAEKLLM